MSDKTNVINPADLAYNNDNRLTSGAIVPQNQITQDFSRVQSLGGTYYTKDFDKEFGSYGIANTYVNQPNFEEMRAQNQGLGEKWLHGAAKWSLLTLNHGVLGLASSIYGTGKAIATGDLSKFYDNDLGRFVDKASEEINKALPHYYTKAEQEAGFWGQVSTANFLFDKMTNGMAFISGAVLSETIAAGVMGATGGLGSGALVGNSIRIAKQAKKVFSAADKASDVSTGARAIQTISGTQRVGKVLRQTITGAGYESGLMARQYLTEVEDEYLKKYRQTNGTDPSQEEMIKFKEDAIQNANIVLGLNMALVAGSNILTLPKTFGLGNKETVKKMNLVGKDIKSSIKEGIKTYSSSFDDWGKFRKSMYYTGRIASKPFTEGIIEEGGQGIIHNAFKDYLLSAYDPENLQDSGNAMESFTKALHEQFTTPEGQVEMFIGALLGGLGSPTIRNGKPTWDGGIFGEYKNIKSDAEFNRNLALELTATDAALKETKDSLKSFTRLSAANNNSDRSALDGDLLETDLNEKKALFAYVEARRKAGLLSEINDDYIFLVQSYSVKEFAEEFGYENMSELEIEARRKNVVKSFKAEMTKMTKAVSTAETVLDYSAFGKYSEDIKEALAYSIYESDRLDEIESKIAQELETIIPYTTSNITDFMKLDNAIANYPKAIKQLKTLITKKTNASKKLFTDKVFTASQDAIGEVVKAQQELAQIEAEYNEAVDNIQSLITDPEYKNNPVEFAKQLESAFQMQDYLNNNLAEKPLDFEKARKLFTDLNKIATKRLMFINDFNQLTNPEKAAELVDELEKAIIKSGEVLFGTEITAEEGPVPQSQQTAETNTLANQGPIVANPELVSKIKTTLEKAAQSMETYDATLENGEETSFYRDKSAPKNSRGYLRKSTVVESTMPLRMRGRFEESRNAGNIVDRIVKNFLIKGEFPASVANMSIEALEELKSGLKSFKEQMNKLGYNTFVADVKVKTQNGTDTYGDWFAGEIDIVAIRDDGKAIIIDAKTSKASITDNSWNTVYENTIVTAGKAPVQELIKRSKKDQYTLDQSIYKRLLEEDLGIKVDGIFLLPVHTQLNGANELTQSKVEDLTELEYNKTSTGETIDRFFKSTSQQVGDSYININQFTSGTLFAKNDNFYRSLQAAINTHGRDTILSKGVLRITNKQIGKAPYPAPNYKGSTPLNLGINDFMVELVVNGDVVASFKRPDRFLDSTNKAYNLADVNVLKQFAARSTDPQLQKMASDYKAMLELFNYLANENSKLSPGASVSIPNDKIKSFLNISVNQQVQPIKEGDRPLLSDMTDSMKLTRKNPVTGEVTSSFFVVNVKDKSLNWNNQKSDIGQDNSWANKQYQQALKDNNISDISELGLYNDNIAIVNTQAGYKFVALSIAPVASETKQSFVDKLIDLNNRLTTMVSAKASKEVIKNELSTEFNSLLAENFITGKTLEGAITDRFTVNIFPNYKDGTIFVSVQSREFSKDDLSSVDKFEYKAEIDSTLLKEGLNFESLIDNINARLKANKSTIELSNLAPNKEVYSESDLQMNAQLGDYTINITPNINAIPKSVTTEQKKAASQEFAEDPNAVAKTAGGLASKISSMGAPQVTSTETDTKAKIAEIENQITAVKNAKTKDELIKASEKLIGINPYDDGAVSMGTRAALMTPGSFEKGKELFLQEIKGSTETKKQSELKALEQTESEPIIENPFVTEDVNELLGKPESKPSVNLDGLPTIDIDIDDDFAGMESTEERVQSFETAKNNLQRILGVPANKMSVITSRFGYNPNLVGAVYNKAIYLANKMPLGTEYHEAFHYVFRTFLSNEEIEGLYNYSKNKFKAPTSEDINKLRLSTSRYNNLSDTELENLYYEEILAEQFRNFANNKKPLRKLNWVERIFKSLYDIIRIFKTKNDDINQLFEDIFNGGFKYAKPKYNIFTNRTSLAPMILNRVSWDNKVSKFTSSESNAIANKILSDVLSTGKLSDKDILIAIAKEADSYDKSNYESEIRGLWSQEPYKAKFAVAQYTIMRNSLSNAENKQLLLDDIKRKLKSYGLKNKSTEEVRDILNLNNDADEVGERNWDLGPDNIEGFQNMNAKMRLYLATTTYTEVDSMGVTRTKAVDGFRLYDSISKVLTNTPKHKMISKLSVYSRNSVEAKAFLTRLKNDIGYDNLTQNQLKSNNTYNLFTASFNQYRVRHYEILADGNKVQLQLSNNKNTAKTQLQKWSSSYAKKAAFITDKQIQEYFTKLSSSLGVIDFNENITNLDEIITDFTSNFADNVDNVYSILNDKLGIRLDRGYIEYSIAQTNIDNLIAIVNNNELDPEDISGNKEFAHEMIKLVAAFKDVEPITSRSAMVLRMVIDKNKSIDIFDKEDGALKILNTIAENNSIFDPTSITTTHKNAEGKMVTDRIKANLLIDRMNSIRDTEAYDPANIGSFEKFREAFPEYNAIQAEILYRGFKNNILFDPTTAANTFAGSLAMIGGTTQVNLIDSEHEGEYNEVYNPNRREGVSYAKQDSRGRLHTLLSMFATMRPKFNVGEKAIGFVTGAIPKTNYAIFQLGVADSNSTYGAELPVYNYKYTKQDIAILEGKSEDLISVADNTLKGGEKSILQEYYNLLESEISTIAIEKERIENGLEGYSKIFGYNTKGKKGVEPRATDLFYFKNDMLKYAPELYNAILSNPNDFINGNNRTQIYQFFDARNKAKLAELKAYMASPKVELNEKLLPKYFLNEDGKTINDNKLAQFIVNDEINVYSFNRLVHGDLRFGFLDSIDVVKRATLNQATGNSFGEGSFTAAVINVPKKEVLTDQGVAEVDWTDAQSWGTVMYKMHKLASEGKFPTVVKDIYENKIFRGKKLSLQEVEILMNEGANLNPDKDVYSDGMVKFKHSEFVITRELTSNIKQEYRNAESIAQLDKLYDKILDLKTQFESGEISKEDYKTQTTKIYEQIHERWEPKENIGQGLHEELNKMELQSIDKIYTDSASKGASIDINANNAAKYTAHEYANKYNRRQLETGGFKTKVTDGTQKMSLVWSEQEADAVAKFLDRADGYQVNMSAISTQYMQLLADRVKKSFELKKQSIIDRSGAAKFEELMIAFKESLDSSNVNPFIAEMFSGDSQPEYNFNTIPIVRKFEAMFLNFLSNGVLKQKAPGLKLTLVSNYGIRDLQHRVYDKATGSYYSECVLSEYFLNKHGLKVGDNIPPELLKMLGVRIPTQDKHSMMSLKVVDFLPSIYGNAGVFPPEIVYLSGADFDIDSLYVRIKKFFKGENGLTMFGSYVKSNEPVLAAFDEYIADLAINDRTFSRYLNENNRIDDSMYEDSIFTEEEIQNILNEAKLNIAVEKRFGMNLEAFREAFIKKHSITVSNNVQAFKNPNLFKQYKPITISETNNSLLDLEFRLLNNESEQSLRIGYTPASMDEVDDVIEYFKENLELEDKSALDTPFNIVDRLKAEDAIADGSKGIGPAALFNKAFQLIVNANTVLPDGPNNIEYQSSRSEQVSTTWNRMNSFDSFGKRINDIISSVISMMTDNTKDPKAGKLNLNPNVLSPVLAMTGLGIPLLDSAVLVNQPILLEYGYRITRNKGTLKTAQEMFENNKSIVEEIQAKYISKFNKLIEKYNLQDLEEVLSFDALQSVLKKKANPINTNISELSEEAATELAMQLNTQIKALDMFLNVKGLSDEIFHLTTILALDKGTDSTFGSLDNFENSLDFFGVKLVDNKLVVNENGTAESKYLNFNDILQNSEILSENIKTFLENRKIASKFALFETAPFRQIKNIILQNLRGKLFNYKDTVDKINSDLESFLTTKIIDKTYPWYAEYAKNLYVNGKLKLSDTVAMLQTADEVIVDNKDKDVNPFKQNFFLRFVAMNQKNGFEFFESNTWTNQSDSLVSNLVDSYREIVGSGTKYKFLVDGKVVEFNGSEFGKEVFTYLLFKDGMQYRSNTILQQISPRIYKPISRALDDMMMAFNSNELDRESEIKRLFSNGAETITLQSLSQEFLNRYGMVSYNIQNLPVQKNFAFLKDSNNQYFVKVQSIDGKANYTVDPFTGLDPQGDIVSSRVNAINQLDKFSAAVFESGPSMQVPLIIYQKSSNNKEGKLLRLVEAYDMRDGNKVNKLFVNKNGMVNARIVRYEEIPIQMGNAFKTFGFSNFNDQLEFVKEHNRIYKENKPDKKVLNEEQMAIAAEFNKVPENPDADNVASLMSDKEFNSSAEASRGLGAIASTISPEGKPEPVQLKPLKYNVVELLNQYIQYDAADSVSKLTLDNKMFDIILRNPLGKEYAFEAYNNMVEAYLSQGDSLDVVNNGILANLRAGNVDTINYLNKQAVAAKNRYTLANMFNQGENITEFNQLGINFVDDIMKLSLKRTGEVFESICK